MKKSVAYVLIISIIILVIVLLAFLMNNNKNQSNNDNKKIEMTVDYSKPINLEYKDLGLDDEINYDNVEIKSEDENIASVDGLVVKGNGEGKTTLDVYYNNELMKKIEVEIKEENNEEKDNKEYAEEIKIIIESQGNKDEKTIKVVNGELQERIILKKDDIITIEREIPAETSINDFANKLRDSKEIEVMSATIGQKNGKKTSITTYKALEDVEI